MARNRLQCRTRVFDSLEDMVANLHLFMYLFRRIQLLLPSRREHLCELLVISFVVLITSPWPTLVRWDPTLEGVPVLAPSPSPCGLIFRLVSDASQQPRGLMLLRAAAALARLGRKKNLPVGSDVRAAN